jgi:hypothetical protein
VARGTTRPVSRSQVDPLATALGYTGWSSDPGDIANSAAPSTQVIYATAMYLPPGKVITNIRMAVIIAGAGTAPTGAFVGICSPTTMLAQSANQKDSAQFTAIGEAVLPLSATYTTSLTDSPTGLYYGVLLVNGTWASTNVAFGKKGTLSAGNGVGPSGKFYGTLGTSQTALPANAAAVTFSQITPTEFWFAVN